MRKIFYSIFLCVVLFPSFTIAQKGCLIIHYDDNKLSKVFNNPTSANSSVYKTGNGNNFVWWEGDCGPHTFISTTTSTNRSCSLDVGTETGTEFNLGTTFLAPCGLPLDDYVWVLFLVIALTTFLTLRRKLTFR